MFDATSVTMYESTKRRPSDVLPETAQLSVTINAGFAARHKRTNQRCLWCSLHVMTQSYAGSHWGHPPSAVCERRSLDHVRGIHCISVLAFTFPEYVRGAVSLRLWRSERASSTPRLVLTCSSCSTGSQPMPIRWSSRCRLVRIIWTTSNGWSVGQRYCMRRGTLMKETCSGSDLCLSQRAQTRLLCGRTRRTPHLSSQLCRQDHDVSLACTLLYTCLRGTLRKLSGSRRAFSYHLPHMNRPWLDAAQKQKHVR